LKSALYFGQVRHRRSTPIGREFAVGLYMVYLDLAELDEVFLGRWLWSTKRAAPARWRREDYFGDATKPLDEEVREAVRASGRPRPEGPIRMLTHLRYLGYVQNPVTFYYCFSPDDRRVEAVLAEITNTPWAERHAYVVGPEAFADGARFPKTFHVSPFMGMKQEYRWRLSPPGSSLMVHMENRQEGEFVFDADLRLRRMEIDTRSLARAILTHPLMTARVALGIYYQAARLWLEKVPFIAHPKHGAS
jgi:uncharacterized protein